MLKFFGFEPTPQPLATDYEFPTLVELCRENVKRLRCELAGLRMMSSSGTQCPGMIEHYERLLADSERELSAVSAMRK